jgi:hypothetical protein
MLGEKMIEFKEFLQRKQIDNLAEYCFNRNIDLQPFVDRANELVESGEIENEKVYLELLNGIGKAIGAAGANVMNFGSSVVQGYQNNRVAPQTQQPANNTQQQTQQPQAANPQQAQQQAQQRTQAVQALTKQLDYLQRVVPLMSQQLKTLGT